MKSGSIRLESDGPTDQLDRASMSPLLVVQHTQQVHRLGMIRFTCQDPLI